MLAIFLVAATAQASSTLYVLEQGSARFDRDASALDLADVSSVAAVTLGVTPRTEFTWDGIKVGDVFSRPKATATIIIDGVDQLPMPDETTSFMLFHDAITTMAGVRAVVTGDEAPKAAPSLASVVADSLGPGGTTVTVSGCSKLARISGTRDLDTSSTEHVVSRASAGATGFTDVATNAEAFELPPFSTGFLGASASLDAATGAVTVDGHTFDADDLPFFEELHAMVVTAAATAAAPAGTPATLTFTATKYGKLVARHGEGSRATTAAAAALAVAVRSVTDSITAAFSGRAVVLAVALQSMPEQQGNSVVTDELVEPGTPLKHGHYSYTKGNFDMLRYAAVHEMRNRRDTLAAALGQTRHRRAPAYPGNNTNNTFISECVKYKCTCWKPFAPKSNFQGQMWNTDKSKGKVGCLLANDDGAATTDGKPICTMDNSTGKPGTDVKAGVVLCTDVCFTNEAFCNCSDPNFEASYLYAPQLKKYECESCRTGYDCKNGKCYLETEFSGVFNGGLVVGLTAVAGMLGCWVLLHGIVDVPPGTMLKGGLLDAGAESFVKKMN